MAEGLRLWAARWPRDGREMAERWPRDVVRRPREGREMAKRWPRDGQETGRAVARLEVGKDEGDQPGEVVALARQYLEHAHLLRAERRGGVWRGARRCLPG